MPETFLDKGADLMKRYQRLKGERYNFDERWERMARYIAPSRMGIITQWTPGSKQSQGVYDSTSMMAAEMMAMFIAGHIINPSQQWFGYQLRDPVVGQDDQVREWLEECRDRTLKYLTTSMFYAEGPESLIDYGGFGTGFLLVEEAPQPVNRVVHGFRGFYFHAEKTGRFVIQEGPDGLVDTAMREFELSARVAYGMWKDECSPGVCMAAEKEPDKPYKFVHAIYPRKTEDRKGGGYMGMPWASCWVEFDSKKVVKEGGYRTFPGAVPRYHKTPGEVYGRGRGDIAFPDTWTLNSAKKMGLEDWALKIRPPILVKHDSVIGSLRLTPGAPTTVNTKGQDIRTAMMPFETGSHPEVSHIKEEELRKSIREVFFIDHILQLLQVNKSEMTAFEFARKLELLFRLLGPVYGRLEWEYLYRMIDTCFEIMFHAGAFSDPPPMVMQHTDGMVDVEFQNPIAKAQRAGDAESLLLAMNDLSPLAQSFPQMLDRIDPDKLANGVMMTRGVPASWLRSDDEVAALRKERQKQDTAANDLAAVQGMAEAAGNAAPLVKALSEKATAQAGAGATT